MKNDELSILSYTIILMLRCNDHIRTMILQLINWVRVVFGMPREAIKLGGAEKIAHLDDLSSILLTWLA
jgi:chemotaxis response regulator CheB